MEIRDGIEEPLGLNYAAVVAVCGIIAVWIGLKPVWMPVASWLYSLLPASLMIAVGALREYSVLAGTAFFALTLAVTALFVGDGLNRIP